LAYKILAIDNTVCVAKKIPLWTYAGKDTYLQASLGCVENHKWGTESMTTPLTVGHTYRVFQCDKSSKPVEPIHIRNNNTITLALYQRELCTLCDLDFGVAEAIHRNKMSHVVCSINKQPQLFRIKNCRIGITMVKMQLQYSEARKFAQLQLRSHRCSKVNSDSKNRKTMQGGISNVEVALLSPTNLTFIDLVLSRPNQPNVNKNHKAITYSYLLWDK